MTVSQSGSARARVSQPLSLQSVQMQRSAQKLDPREEHYWIESPRDGLQLFLRYLPAKTESAIRAPVLYVHGATFPSALSIAHRFDGYSWRDALCEAGFDVWGFDFLGYGYSDRYREMNEPPDSNPPLCSATDGAMQLETAASFVLEQHGAASLSIISHSWASMPVCRFAGQHPTMVERIVLFAPIAHRAPRRYEKPPSAPAWRIVTVEEQWSRFVEDVPPHEQPVLSRTHFDEWAERYLDSDTESRTCTPPGVKTPTGPFNDILRAWHGDLAYDPAQVQAPVAIIRGEWDGLVPDDDARWLFDAFSASPIKRDIKISRGTHLMHLEEMRLALYRESISFLMADDQARPGAAPHRPRQQKGVKTMDAPREQQQQQRIPGYDLGTDKVAKSPITMQEWEELKKSALFSEEDVVYLRLSEKLLEDHVEDLLDAWRGIVFDLPHLSAYYEDPNSHQVDTEYAKAVRKRFGQWILDTARANYDQAWLDYQYEIGIRHHRMKKNKTDGGHTLGHIRARDIIAFVPSIVIPIKPYLATSGYSREVVECMYHAWWKSMVLQATLWCQPYFREGDF
jgi:pimeloyl-ACP methyl ester carboxylesterase